MKILFCIIFCFSFFSVSYACSCVVNLPESEEIRGIKEADAIFYGEVISIGESHFGQTKPITFKVLRTWKGISTEEVTIEANANDSCQLNVEAGEKLLIYTGNEETKNSDNYLHYCSPDQFDKNILEEIYGKGEIVEPEKQTPEKSEVSESFLSMIWRKFTSFFS